MKITIDEYCKKCKSKLTICPTCTGKGIVYGGGLLSGYSKKLVLIAEGLVSSVPGMDMIGVNLIK